MAFTAPAVVGSQPVVDNASPAGISGVFNTVASTSPCHEGLPGLSVVPQKQQRNSFESTPECEAELREYDPKLTSKVPLSPNATMSVFQPIATAPDPDAAFAENTCSDVALTDSLSATSVAAANQAVAAPSTSVAHRGDAQSVAYVSPCDGGLLAGSTSGEMSLKTPVVVGCQPVADNTTPTGVSWAFNTVASASPCHAGLPEIAPLPQGQPCEQVEAATEMEGDAEEEDAKRSGAVAVSAVATTAAEEPIEVLEEDCSNVVLAGGFVCAEDSLSATSVAAAHQAVAAPSTSVAHRGDEKSVALPSRLPICSPRTPTPSRKSTCRLLCSSLQRPRYPVIGSDNCYPRDPHAAYAPSAALVPATSGRLETLETVGSGRYSFRPRRVCAAEMIGVELDDDNEFGSGLGSSSPCFSESSSSSCSSPRTKGRGQPATKRQVDVPERSRANSCTRGDKKARNLLTMAQSSPVVKLERPVVKLEGMERKDQGAVAERAAAGAFAAAWKPSTRFRGGRGRGRRHLGHRQHCHGGGRGTGTLFDKQGISEVNYAKKTLPWRGHQDGVDPLGVIPFPLFDLASGTSIQCTLCGEYVPVHKEVPVCFPGSIDFFCRFVTGSNGCRWKRRRLSLNVDSSAA
eukprot:TRINITY_DN13880_c0_g1_i2.p1 TRINITY_DN13880_c0_g1~~TRINITY_DN13880_c0_g1_i2.p1  ORF type:complete len:644 (-),score=92.69 TRINITY_DN13880_c0_g1_i2:145-2034(-)